jgi:hypothetical protein
MTARSFYMPFALLLGLGAFGRKIKEMFSSPEPN